jgi:hypothetical protein
VQRAQQWSPAVRHSPAFILLAPRTIRLKGKRRKVRGMRRMPADLRNSHCIQSKAVGQTVSSGQWLALYGTLLNDKTRRPPGTLRGGFGSHCANQADLLRNDSITAVFPFRLIMMSSAAEERSVRATASTSRSLANAPTSGALVKLPRSVYRTEILNVSGYFLFVSGLVLILAPGR